MANVDPRASTAPTANGAGPEPSAGRDWACAAPLLMAFAILSYGASLRIGITTDEPVGIAGGFALLTRHEMVINYEHPPLIKTLAALPLLGMHPPIDASDEDYRTGREWLYARTFMFDSGVSPDAILRRVHVVPLLFGIALGAAVFGLARRTWGRAGGLLSLCFYCFDPAFLGHAPVVQFDVGISFFLFVGVWAFAVALRRPRDWWHFVLAGGCLGFGLGTKFTAVSLCFLWGALLLLERPRIDGRLLRGVGLLLVTAAATLSLCYGFVLLPEFVRGFLWQVRHARDGHVNYLLGVVRPRAQLIYFPVAMLLKTPLETLSAMALAALVAVRTFGDARVRLCVVGAVGFFLLMLPSSIGIGHRYLLPLYPFAFVLIGGLARGHRTVGWGLALLLALRCLAVFPEYIGYTNAVAGSRPELYLADSNLDWGQDLPALERYLRDTGLDSFGLGYSGMDSPTARGIEARPIPCERVPGVYVVSINSLVGVFPPRVGPCLAWLRQEQPVDRIGTSMLVFVVKPRRVTEPGPPDP